jgi:5-formyltetrahydrofolate cyclo-ligase
LNILNVSVGLMEKSIKIQKQELRQKVWKLKAGCSSEEKLEKSRQIFAELEKLSDFVNAKTVMCYWSMPDEVETTEFILKYMNEKKFVLPVVKKDELELRYFEGVESLRPGGAFNIMEPTGQILSDSSELELIIVPGVAFDKNMNRLGHGKAYYDKLLSRVKAIKIGVCFDFQFFDIIPVDGHDVKMDQVIYA